MFHTKIVTAVGKVRAEDMKIGDIGVTIEKRDTRSSTTVLKSAIGLIDLNDPGWKVDSDAWVNLLPRGSVVTLEIK